MTESEIANLRHQIELECEAMRRGLTGFAMTAKHEIVAHKYDQLGIYQSQLEKLVGEEQALCMIAEIYTQAMNEEDEPPVKSRSTTFQGQ
jgi:hypothetical protein